MTTAREVIERHYAASDRGDLDGMLSVLADDIVWTEAAGFPLAGTYVGPQSVAQNVFAALQRDWEGFALAVDEIVDCGDTVIGIGTYTGTDRGTGKPFQARVVHIWRVEDGKAVRFEQVADTAQIVAAAS
ncbi:nuclear transport factor 2 family protein [Cnuibacter physcomitrellae]|uniref:nuclear transport factor 2 family protein n=1 Tax=Cnuibacter physcomitrellae TaxID=1619308 RepID=UPI0021761518|nr:nuclear transport factor 2 family protein [Cnuibacter physcomitrellae]MCS5498346.1 nuclear transport factor 2 family protein [Cnuibacter physcomitrellae]